MYTFKSLYLLNDCSSTYILHGLSLDGKNNLILTTHADSEGRSYLLGGTLEQCFPTVFLDALKQCIYSMTFLTHLF